MRQRYGPFVVLIALLASVGGIWLRSEMAPKSVVPERAPAVESRTQTLMAEPMVPAVVETAAEALLVWREHRAARPTLLLLDNNPRLMGVPAVMQERIRNVFANGDEGALRRAVDVQGADPLLLPDMALTAALQAGYFGRVIWAPVITTEAEKYSLEGFQSNLMGRAELSDEERKSFKLERGVFSGKVRGVPIVVAPLFALPEISEPVLVHFDSGYFAPLYRTEVSTNLYSLVRELFTTLRARQLSTLAVTVSHSNLGSGGLPLTTRFLADDMASLVRSPAMLDEAIPPLWDHRSKIMYLENLFEKKRIFEHYQSMLALSPNDPAVHYGLFLFLTEVKDVQGALDALARAVELDPIYALEYLDLARWAEEKKMPTMRREFEEKAVKALPGNASLRLVLAETLRMQGDAVAARELLQTLDKEPWSPVYYPGMKELIAKLLEAN